MPTGECPAGPRPRAPSSLRPVSSAPRGNAGPPADQHAELEETGRAPTFLSRIQSYRRESVSERGEDAAGFVWKKGVWRGCFKAPREGKCMARAPRTEMQLALETARRTETG